jgi:RNA polymerase sigma-70 factor (ECF subfamily)
VGDTEPGELSRTAAVRESSPGSVSHERALVDAANRGEASAFEELYRSHRDWVLRIATRFTPTHADALDVVQETFVHLWSRFPGFRLEGRLGSFLYTVAQNAARNQGRKAKRREAQSDEALAGLPAEAKPAAAGDPREELAGVLAALPEPQREVLLLRFVDDLELAEIAEAISIPLGTVKSRLHQALGTLREDPRTKAYFER